jgi:hypothetical protein
VEELHFETFISSSENDRNFYRGRYFSVVFLEDLFILSVSIIPMFASFRVFTRRANKMPNSSYVLSFVSGRQKKGPDKEEERKVTSMERDFPRQFPAVGFNMRGLTLLDTI